MVLDGRAARPIGGYKSPVLLVKLIQHMYPLTANRTSSIAVALTYYLDPLELYEGRRSEIPEGFANGDFYTHNSIGATCGAQTRDLLHGKQTFYQLN